MWPLCPNLRWQRQQIRSLGTLRATGAGKLKEATGRQSMAQCKEQLLGNLQPAPRMEALSWKGCELLIFGDVSRGWTKGSRRTKEGILVCTLRLLRAVTLWVDRASIAALRLEAVLPACFSLLPSDSEPAIHIDLHGQGPYRTGVFPFPARPHGRGLKHRATQDTYGWHREPG